VSRSRLVGKRVLVARAEGQAEGPARLLRERGAEAVVIPSIVIGPPDDGRPLARAVKRLGDFDWVVFTSANGVERTFDSRTPPPEIGRTSGGGPRDGGPAFSSARFAVVGKATREALESRGGVASLQAKEFRGEGLAEPLLEAMKGSSRRVLILRAQEASDALPDALRAGGATVEVAPAYRTRPSPEGTAAIRQLLLDGGLDVVVFSSGSTVDAICNALGPPEPLARVTVACIGPVTHAAALARGVRVDVVPAVATFAAVIEALEEHFPAI
jgi:uroporphyrinogen III methyltransferase/synthase